MSNLCEKEPPPTTRYPYVNRRRLALNNCSN
jgi:hypothetical protein